jgi:branched-chain amino acid transport system substrate-binding protein
MSKAVGSAVAGPVNTRRRTVQSRLKAATGALALAGCVALAVTGASVSSAASPLGAAKKATGKPIVFGMINLEAGPVTFPEIRQAAQAGISYVNNYRGGLHGRPIKLLTCTTDGQPATSARCANQLADKGVVAMLGAADTGASGSYPVYNRKKLSVIGGLPFTPVESNAKNGAIFLSVSVGDNAAVTAYAAKKLGAKSMAILQASDNQGKYSGSIIANVAKNLGLKTTQIDVTSGAPDQSAPAAAAAGYDIAFVETPGSCPPVIKALRSTGFKGKIIGLDNCASPPAIAATGSVINGFWFAQPYYDIDANKPDARLGAAILAKYAPKNIALDTLALAGLSEVMNLQQISTTIPASKLTSAGILAAIKDGKVHPNFMGHPYQCTGKMVPAQSASCDKWELIKAVQGGKVVTLNAPWTVGANYYKP